MANKHGLSTASAPFLKQLWVYWWFKANWRGLVVVPSEAEEWFGRSCHAELSASSFWVMFQGTGCLAVISSCSVSIRDQRQTGKLFPQRRWVSHVQLLKNSCSGQSRAQTSFVLAFPPLSEISLNPKSPTRTGWALQRSEHTLTWKLRVVPCYEGIGAFLSNNSGMKK